MMKTKLEVGMRVKLFRAKEIEELAQKYGSVEEGIAGVKWLAEGKGFIPDGTMGTIRQFFPSGNKDFPMFYVEFDDIKPEGNFKFGIGYHRCPDYLIPV